MQSFASISITTYFFVETVDNKRFLHAEIHPVNVMSDKIEKLHSYLLKTKMVKIIVSHLTLGL